MWSIRKMKTHLRILNLYIAFSGVLMKSGNDYEGTVGQTVDIRCPVPDEYTNTPKYFCRDPCASKNVLIQTEKTDLVVSAGRYSVVFTVNAKTFAVTIRHLTLKDSGVYYCGIDKWFADKQIKVKLSVKAPASSFSSTDTPQYTVSTRMKTDSSADSSSSPPTVHSTNSKAQTDYVKTNSVDVSVVCIVVLWLLVFWFLVTLVLLYKRRSHTKSESVTPSFPENPVPNLPDINQTVGHVYHLYDESLTDHSVVGCPVKDNASLIYSTVQNCSPAPHDDMNSFYSVITATNIK
ncbi:CMRF35-like molecule 5 isoform X2 [Triplophysa dalaica]|uniref:CMRF35-like molecule 5 isoform X2 n=1 Tax=Triplophysa dalaica TaxID=1582913 RepID=UPI0024E00D97|nr:CMRF35-like molecule 5 isoform X2 [Triplophysa dalaica]